MANAVVGQIYLVTFKGTMAGQTLLNTFRYRLETLGTAITTADITTNMDLLIASGGNLSPKFIGAVPPQYTLDERWYQCVSPSRIRKVIVNAALAGTFAGTGSTPNASVSIERFAEVATRHGVGRLQLPAANDSANVTNGIINGPGYTGALAALAAQMILPLTLPTVGSTMKPVLQDLRNPGVFNYIIGASAKNTMRVMRRRTVGVGK